MLLLLRLLQRRGPCLWFLQRLIWNGEFENLFCMARSNLYLLLLTYGIYVYPSQVMTSCYSCTGSCTSSVTHVRSKSHPTTENSSNYQLIAFSVCIFLLSQVSGTYTDLGANSDDYTYEQVGWSPDKSMKEATFV